MKKPTPENVCALILGDFKVAKLWPSITMTANRYGCEPEGFAWDIYAEPPTKQRGIPVQDRGDDDGAN